MKRYDELLCAISEMNESIESIKKILGGKTVSEIIKDSKRLDNLEELLKSENATIVVTQDYAHIYNPNEIVATLGYGTDLRSAIDSLKKD